MTSFGKVEISPNREDWSPVPLPEQIALVTTADAEGNPHVAAKSRFSVISYGPPTMVVFMCRNEYPTFLNIDATGEFVINVPGSDLVATSWVIGLDPSDRGPKLFSENGLSPIPSIAVKPPRIAECRAHIECRVIDKKKFSYETATFAEVVAVSISKEIADKNCIAAKYQSLSPFFFLEAGWTAALGCARPAEEPVSGPKHDVTILAVSDLNRSVDFYMSAFDWKIKTKSKHYVEFILPDGLGLALCSYEGFQRIIGTNPQLPDEGVAPAQVYLRTDDILRVIARLHAVNAKPLSKAAVRDWGEEVAYFADPDGHVLAIARAAYSK